ncbi:MAG TPA: DUF4097 family beta strand repeat-containing protein [Pseudonocardiaceae bacterium]|nr:DUF4097 family beta strand repeat-containing protein [Pseudonocardiaceae bacterium]
MVTLRAHPIAPLSAGLLIASVLAVGGCDHGPGATSSQNSSENSYTVAEPLTSLMIDNPVGSTRIEGTDAAAVSVTETLHYTGDPPRTSHVVTGGQLTLTYACPPGTVSDGTDACGVSYVVKMPRRLATRIDNKVGEATLTGLAGELNLTTSTGDIDATGLTSRAVTARASTGAITLAFAAAPATVDAQTHVGSVTVRLPADTAYAVDAGSQVGSAEVTVRQDSGSAHHISARSQVGSVTVTNS